MSQRRDRATVRAAFVDPEEFWSSPLYRHLCTVVAADDDLVELAAHARAGQVATFAFFGAVHDLLLGGVVHPLGDFYPSLRGDAALAPDGAGPALVSFTRVHGDALREILRTRLVQTNQVRRAVALRLGLAHIADSVGRAPVHLLEVGASAGLLLRHAAYRYRLGEQDFGVADSPVRLVTEWCSDAPVPDLDAIPTIATSTGVDLHPLDPAEPADRCWLEALVWPEDREKAVLLHDALLLAAGAPLDLREGDAIDLCPVWAREVPAGEPRVVFHSATRMHVPTERLAAFDAAIEGVGSTGPAYRIALESSGIVVTGPDGVPATPYEADGHLAWVRPHEGGEAR